MTNRKPALTAILILMLLGILVSACSKSTDPAGATTLPGQTAATTTEDINLTVESNDSGVTVHVGDASLVSGEDLDWPADKVPDLPEPDGNIQAVMTNDLQKSVSITIGDLSSAQSDDYVDALKSAGFTADIETPLPNGHMFSGTGSKGTIVYTYSADEDMAVLIYTTMDLDT